MYLDKSSASRLVDGLEKRGYARRLAHPEDGRAILVEVTPGGVAIHTRIVEDTLVEQRGLLGEFDPEVRQAMTRLIARLARAAVGRAHAGQAPCCAPLR
jgi:DNA-binding MarR family transcriptional regulator